MMSLSVIGLLSIDVIYNTATYYEIPKSKFVSYRQICIWDLIF